MDQNLQNLNLLTAKIPFFKEIYTFIMSGFWHFDIFLILSNCDVLHKI